MYNKMLWKFSPDNFLFLNKDYCLVRNDDEERVLYWVEVVGRFNEKYTAIYINHLNGAKITILMMNVESVTAWNIKIVQK